MLPGVLFALWLRKDRELERRARRRAVCGLCRPGPRLLGPRTPKRVLYTLLAGYLGLSQLTGALLAALLALAAAVDAAQRSGLASEPALCPRCADYDPERCEALRRFAPIKAQTQCTFARGARVWGSRDYDPALSVEANVRRSAPMLERFCREPRDAFLVEARGEEHGVSPAALGRAVNRVLRELARLEPSGRDCMADSRRVGRAGWAFRFGDETFFVTAFAPCYPASSARFAFDAPRDSVFVLLQPDSSFARHDLSPDTPHTDWDNPGKTERNRIRCRFREAGRPYVVPPTVSYPMAHYMVPPLVLGGGPVEWWLS